MRARIVLAFALALVGAGVVLALSQRGERLAGTSHVPQSAYAVVVPARATACQRGTLLADDSAAAQVLVGTYGHARPPLGLRFTADDGTVVARGSASGVAGQGPVTVRFADGAVEGARVVKACVRNGGARPIALAGAIAAPSTAARIGETPTGGVVGFRYLRSERASWWSIAPVVAQRAGRGKASIFGTWTLPLLTLALVGLWVTAVRILLKETDA